MPIEGVVLQMKSMHIHAVVNFPFPTPPDRLALRKAETILTHLGALAAPPTLVSGGKQGAHVLNGTTVGGHITSCGKAMSLFPLTPRFSRMLVGGRQHGCLPYVITIISALSVGDIFIREEALEGGKNDGDQSEELAEEIGGESKELLRLRRKKFFHAQQVIIPPSRSRFRLI